MKRIILISITFIFIIITSSCSNDNANDQLATISVNAESDYEKTFTDLNLGNLYDFQLKIPNADERWVTLWVERYKDGVKESDPVAELSYGMSPEEKTEGNIGFGILNPNTDTPMAFLYGPGVKISPVQYENHVANIGFFGGDYAIGEDEVELQLGETYLLAIFRQSTKTSFSVYDLPNEEEVKKKIKKSKAKIKKLKTKIKKFLPRKLIKMN